MWVHYQSIVKPEPTVLLLWIVTEQKSENRKHPSCTVSIFQYFVVTMLNWKAEPGADMGF